MTETIDASDVIIDVRASGYLVAFSSPPPIGVRVVINATTMATLIDVEPYARKDGTESYILHWQRDDGVVVSTGMKSKGAYTPSNKYSDKKENRQYITKRQRFRIFVRDDFRCKYCGATPDKKHLHADHVIPVCQGGTSDDDNLLTACSDCNLGKAGKTISQINEVQNGC